MAFSGVDDRQAPLTPSGKQGLGRCQGRGQGAHIIAEGSPKTPRLKKVALEVDQDQGGPHGREGVGIRLGRRQGDHGCPAMYFPSSAGVVAAGVVW